MAKKQLNKSYSSFSRDQIVNRAKQVRRDNDTVKTPKCTIEDVDWAIMSYLQDIVKPQIIENGQTIDVPVMYANGEKWAMVQSRGYMRDAKNKIMTPLISIRRGSIIERDTLRKLDVNINPAGNEQILRNKFSKAHRYDRFSILRGQKPVHEFHVMAIPEFIDVSYELFVWTEYTEQMNSLIEQLMPLGGFAWGTTWKFPTMIADYTFDTTQADGEDRIVRATIPLTTKATLLMPFELQKSTIQKNYSVKRVSFKNEVETFDVNVTDSPPNGYPDNTKDNFKDVVDNIEIRVDDQIPTQQRWASPVFHKEQRKINKL
tara:strand:+ start:19 stop:969 length:951 start_codon:yes stop_codon:yes gene_type:complete